MDRFPINSENYRDSDNRWRTGIFYRGDKAGPLGVYTFEEGRRVFLESATEYEAAMRFVTSYEHWKAIAKSAHCKPMIELWREEKLLADQTKARQQLLKAADNGNLTAARVIYEAKKEERSQKERVKAQKQADQREEEILNRSQAKLISIKAQQR